MPAESSRQAEYDTGGAGTLSQKTEQLLGNQNRSQEYGIPLCLYRGRGLSLLTTIDVARM